jgi:long-chain acyl-CoA synthetase
MKILPEKDWTLTDLFLARVRQSPHGQAYRWFDGQNWVQIDWSEAEQRVGRFRAALERDGLKPGDRVGICSRNRIEWMCFDQAALSLGLVVVPLFYNDRPDNLAYCLTDAGARLFFVEDGKLWEAMRSMSATIERAVCITNTPAGDAKAVPLDKWLPASGTAVKPSPAKADELATLVYTSGTTGRPKGVMLTHRNIISDLAAVLEAVPELLGRPFRFLSFLPLSHMFERTVGYYIPMCIGDRARVVYARGIQELTEDLVSQRPTVLVSVPRIFERVHSKIEEALAARPSRRRLFEQAAALGWRRFRGEPLSPGQRLRRVLLDALIGRKLRARFGGRLQYVLIGGAAMAAPLMRLFTGLGLRFIHGYGLTETAPVLSCIRLGAHDDPLSVGRPLRGVEVAIGEGGELLVRGPIVTPGYWNNPAATAAAIGAEGWFHSGDVVERRDGLLYIRGRLKEIIVLSNGEKVAPGDVEQAILEDPAFEQALVLGEGRAHLGLLAVSKLADERMLCARANRRLQAFPGYVRIRHIARLAEPWTVENGLITPTLKLKRGEIERRHAAAIEAMYRRDDLCREPRPAVRRAAARRKPPAKPKRKTAVRRIQKR